MFRPQGNFSGHADYNYQTVKCNVDVMNVIQLGVTFTDSQGNLPSGISTWQFNFKFDLESDLYAVESVEFLKSSGIDFVKHKHFGIDPVHFGELIMSSGLVMNESVYWISFHGSFDFGYAVKLLTSRELPDTEAEFSELLRLFFPRIFDIKHLLRHASNLTLPCGQSLQAVADALDVNRIGQQHQAGSDSLITGRTFFKLIAYSFNNRLDEKKFSGVLFGLGIGCQWPPVSSSVSSLPPQSAVRSEPTGVWS